MFPSLMPLYCCLLQKKAICLSPSQGFLVHPLLDRICQHSSSPHQAMSLFTFLLWPDPKERNGCELLHMSYLKPTALAMEAITGRSDWRTCSAPPYLLCALPVLSVPFVCSQYGALTVFIVLCYNMWISHPVSMLAGFNIAMDV